MDLLTLAVLCGPLVDPAMTLRVITVESAGHPYAIHDNSTGDTFDSATAAAAESIANSLLKAGHRDGDSSSHLIFSHCNRQTVQFPRHFKGHPSRHCIDNRHHIS